MKNIVKIAALLLLAFSSCKKEKSTAPAADGKLHTVNFTFKEFNVEYAEAKTKGMRINGLSTQATETSNIYVLIYDSAGKIYQQTVLQKGSNGFSAKSYLLPAGLYTCIFIGSSYISSNVNNYLRLINVNVLNSGIAKHYDGDFFKTPLQETFYKKIIINVENTDITSAIDLTRVVAGLKVIVKDAIPSNAVNVVLTVDTLYTAMQVKDGLPLKSEFVTANTYSFNVTNLIGTSGVSFTRNMFTAPNNTVSVSLKAFDKYQEVIATKAIRNIVINPNKITVLSGNLFGGNGSNNNAIDVKADTTWSSDILYQSF